MTSQDCTTYQLTDIGIGIAWCLTWGNHRNPDFNLNVLQQMRQALKKGGEVPEEVRSLVEQVANLQAINGEYFPETIKQLRSDYPDLWQQQTPIGLVYGGATKIKQYVFEAAKLPDIRGASALLDRINLLDLPAFFHGEESPNFPQCQQAKDYCKQVREEWLNLEHNFPDLSQALIPELIIYSTGGNILAFCPAAFVDDLANAIEKRYTEETLTANSCAVGANFRLLEIRFGLLKANEDTLWLDWYRQANAEENETKRQLIKAYFGSPKNDGELIEAFKNRKSFNELAGKLAGLFNQRRSGNDSPGNHRPSRCYPPMFETHPYLVRDEGNQRSAVAIIQPPELPGETQLSETLARKRIIGQFAKRELNQNSLPAWFHNLRLSWQPIDISIKSWIYKFEKYLNRQENQQLAAQYYTSNQNIEEARTLRELGNVSRPKGFVAYIYADGNNMGGYIQKIRTPTEYKQFSEDIFKATEESVYEALARHLQPRQLDGLSDPDNKHRNKHWVHPFEILTIGGDDVMLIVPADKALEIAQTIGSEFENRLNLHGDRYKSNKIYDPKQIHRYQGKDLPSGADQCKLSMSVGVLITAEDTPIYYAENLTSQLLKSAKKRVKDLAKKGYSGGIVDFLAMKSVTMLSSSISTFREQGLVKLRGQQKLKLYSAPYTLYELGGFLMTLRALKCSGFPRSQLYQIRSLLEQGKNTAILNYLYFRVRLSHGQTELKQHFENAWCQAQTNDGNLAPWRFAGDPKSQANKGKEPSTYETIWRELVELYPFVDQSASESSTSVGATKVNQ